MAGYRVPHTYEGETIMITHVHHLVLTNAMAWSLNGAIERAAKSGPLQAEARALKARIPHPMSVRFTGDTDGETAVIAFGGSEHSRPALLEMLGDASRNTQAMVEALDEIRQETGLDDVDRSRRALLLRNIEGIDLLREQLTAQVGCLI